MPELPAINAPKPLEESANKRLAECRRQKEDNWVLDFREAYFFADPNRQRQLLSTTAPMTTRVMDNGELQTSLGILLSQDFVTEIVNTFMPEATPWCKRGPGMFVAKKAWDQVEKQVGEDDIKIFGAMKASNLYPEVAKGFNPDLAIGTVGLWIDQRYAHQPICVKSVPLREIECSLGPDGDIDDRWAIRWTRNRYVEELLSGITLPADILAKIKEKPEEKIELRWGFWRIYEAAESEKWQAVVMVGNKLVDDTVLTGEGSCPLIVGRFNPTPDWPWGFGPLLQGLPDLRQVDELEAQKINNVELSLTPPFTYPDDSFAAIEQGLEPGFGYPIRVGSHDAVKAIYDPPPPDAGIYAHEEMEHRLRKLFFVDFPEQTGDTPPTATQWLDELARRQRRVGTPGLPFWREVPARIFLRFKYLLEAAGAIAPVTVDGTAIAVTPMNPAQLAAEQQEIATAVQALQLFGQMFPEEFKLRIDGNATMVEIMRKMRVTLIKFRDDAAVKAILPQIAQLLQGKPGSAGAEPAAPA